MNKESKNIFYVIVIALILVLLFGLINKNNNKFKNISEVVDKVLKSEGSVALYIGSSDCEPCLSQGLEMSLVLENYDFGYYYVDVAGLSKSNLSKIVQQTGLVTNQLTTPSILIYKDGKFDKVLEGLNGADELFEFLSENSIIKEGETLPIQYHDLDSYVNLLNGNDVEVIALGSPVVNNNDVFQRCLWEIAKENNVKINYFNLYTLTESQGKQFEKTLPFLEKGDFDVPIILIVKDKQVLSSISSFQDKEGIVNFLKETEIIK